MIFRQILTTSFGVVALGMAVSATAAQPQLVGRWELQEWDGYDSTQSSVHPWIAFKADGEVEMFDGCELHVGRYSVNGGLLEITPPVRSGRGCGSKDRWAMAMTFFAPSLAQKSGFHISGPTLIVNTMGSDNLKFRSTNTSLAAEQNPTTAARPSGRPPRPIRRDEIVRFADAEFLSRVAGYSGQNELLLAFTCEVAADGTMQACALAAPSVPQQAVEMEKIARAIKVKPGVTGPFIFKFQF